MHTKQKWLLAAASSLIIVGAVFGSSRFLNEGTAENSKNQQAFNKQPENILTSIKAEVAKSEQQIEEELKQAALKEVDSRTAYEQFTAKFAAYKDMHLIHSTHYANKEESENYSNQKTVNELEKKAELIVHFENELVSNSKTGEQLLNDFNAAIEKLEKEL